MSAIKSSGARNQEDSFAGAFTPALAASGTAPPAVTIQETAFANALLHIQILTPGILGVGIFQYSINGGALQVGISLGAAVILPLLPNVTVKFAAGSYAADNAFNGIV